jgi:endonuclease YncB( thermonuclease family)
MLEPPQGGFTQTRAGNIIHVQPSSHTSPPIQTRLNSEASSFHLCGSGPGQNCVIDGDTIRYRGATIRLADIDTPEISAPKCASEEALGHRAKNRLLQLMNAGTFDVLSIGGREQDQYGRKLRVIKRNGRSIGDTLITEGLARRWDGARRNWCG